jgi:hypothetical protein
MFDIGISIGVAAGPGDPLAGSTAVERVQYSMTEGKVCTGLRAP